MYIISKRFLADGHPFYLFGGDTSAGQTSGQGVNAFGGLWYALSRSGAAVTHSGSTSVYGRGY